MKDLFFTTNKPKHRFKTEKFFFSYLKTRKLASKFVSGSPRQFSNFKRMLLLKKFFLWYYNIKSWTFFVKIFKLKFLQKRYTFKYLLSLYHLLERNLLVVLVRSKFCLNLMEALFYIKAKFIFVNGYPVTFAFYSTKVGDIVEIIPKEKYFLLQDSFLFILLRSDQYKSFYSKYFKRLREIFYIQQGIKNKFLFSSKKVLLKNNVLKFSLKKNRENFFFKLKNIKKKFFNFFVQKQLIDVII